MQTAEFVATFYLRSSGHVCGIDGCYLNRVRRPDGLGVRFDSLEDALSFSRQCVSDSPFIGVAVYELDGRAFHQPEKMPAHLVENPAFTTDVRNLGIAGQWTVRYIERETFAWITPSGAYWTDKDPDPAIVCSTESSAIEHEARRCFLGGHFLVDAYVYGPNQFVHRLNGSYYVASSGSIKKVSLVRRLFDTLLNRSRRTPE